MSNADPEHDLGLLQGTWRQVAFEQNGIDDPPDDHGAPNSLTTIERHRYSVRTAKGDLILQGSFVLDVATTPKSVVWTDDDGPQAGRSLECSYRLDPDRFVFIAAHDGGPRPTDFVRTRPGQTMRVFVRLR